MIFVMMDSILVKSYKSAAIEQCALNMSTEWRLRTVIAILSPPTSCIESLFFIDQSTHEFLTWYFRSTNSTYARTWHLRKKTPFLAITCQGPIQSEDTSSSLKLRTSLPLTWPHFERSQPGMFFFKVAVEGPPQLIHGHPLLIEFSSFLIKL